MATTARQETRPAASTAGASGGLNVPPLQPHSIIPEGATQVFPDNIPVDLRELPAWVCWRREQRKGKSTKVPYTPKGYKASVSDPSTWTTFDAALDAYSNGGGFDGIGIVLSDDCPLFGGDLDHCIADDGSLKPWAAEIVLALGTYTEVSPSGRGLRIIGRGKLPPGRRRSGNIELYDGGRYLTITGNHVPDTPATIEDRRAELEALHARLFPTPEKPETPRPPAEPVDLDDAELIRKASNANGNGAKFARLWAGDWTGYDSPSEADLALCNALTFWTAGDPERVDRLFRQSGLMRDKWDKRHYSNGQTYGQATVDKALSDATEFYNPSRFAANSAPAEPSAIAKAFDQTVRQERSMAAQGAMAWRFRTLTDAYAPRKPLEFCVDGLLTMPSLSIPYGAPGCLKSFLLADLALSVASGTPWLPPIPTVNDATPFATTLVPVVWLDFDNGTRRTDERIEALARARSLEPESTPFYYVSMPTPWLDGSDPASIDALIDRFTELSVGLVIIDNLGTVNGGADENSADMIQVLANFRRLAESTGAAVVLIHHQRKSTGYNSRAGETLRGHSSIEAALDLALLIEREERSSEVTIRSTKSRDLDVPPFGAIFTYEHQEGSKELAIARFWGTLVQDTSSDTVLEQAILEAVEDEPGIQKEAFIETIKEALPDVGVNRIRKRIDRMAAEGDLEVVRGGKTGRAKCYTVP